MKVKWPQYVRGKAQSLALGLVRKALKERGEKPSTYNIGDLTRAANVLLEEKPEIYLEASSAVILELTATRAEARKEMEKGK